MFSPYLGKLGNPSNQPEDVRERFKSPGRGEKLRRRSPVCGPWRRRTSQAFSICHFFLSADDVSSARAVTTRMRHVLGHIRKQEVKVSSFSTVTAPIESNRKQNCPSVRQYLQDFPTAEFRPGVFQEPDFPLNHNITQKWPRDSS